jgi:ATP-dependent exoDNAse (exonuclease V) beta subunit
MPDILWCKPEEAPFDALPLAPIDYSEKQLRGTIYERDYLDEHLQNTVDNLNLLYVAFTRAVSSLYVIGQRGNKKSRSALIETVLPSLNIEDSTLTGMEDENAIMTFSYGNPENSKPSVTRQAHQSENVFLQPVTPKDIELQTFDVKTAFRQSNRSRDFIEGDDEQEISYIKMGSVLHEIFSTIKTTDDIQQSLTQLQQDGILYDDEVTAEKLTKLLQKRLEDKRVANWFSDRWQLFNECSILFMENGKVVERRPDRVMTDGTETHVVDFKFGQPKPEYQEQVREYMQLLSQMNMPNVKGWLWYVYSNKIEEVS